MRTFWNASWLMGSLAILGCGGGDDAPLGGAAGSGGAASDAGPDSTFVPDDPGIHMFFDLGVVLMMGQPLVFAAAGFQPTAREDFEPEPATIPLDTCAPTPPPVQTCTGPADCSPEQQCVPQTDADGNPIPGSEHCVTDRELLDLGPMTVEGFSSGPQTLTFNQGQSGVYTTPGGDGTIQADWVVFDTTYTFHGDGNAGLGLGAFSGELPLGPKLELTQPAMVMLPMGFEGVQISPDTELVLQWTGAVPGGEVTLSLSSASPGGGGTPIRCRVSDTGQFTISADLVQGVGLADAAFFNMLEITRSAPGTATGEGLSVHKVESLQTLLLNVGKAP